LANRVVGSCARIATWIALLALAGCGGDEPAPPRPGQPASSSPGSVPPVAAVRVVEVAETNEDSLALPIEDDDEAEGPDEIRLEDGVLQVSASLAASTDAAVLERAGVTLVEPATPLARCGAVLVHRLRWTGRGRGGGRVRVVAAPSWPVVLDLRRRDVPASVELELGGPESSEDALKALRVFAAGDVRVEAAGGALRVRYGARSVDLAAGNGVDVGDERRAVRVREAGIGREDVLWSTPPDASTPSVVVPAVDLGTVDLRTRLRVVDHGPVELRIEPANPPPGGDEDDLR
jgi:hypothetical protein